MGEAKFKEMVSAARDAIEDFNDMPDDRAIVWAADEIKRLTAAVGKLREALEVFGEHSYYCPVKEDAAAECICGLAKAIRGE